MIQFEVDLKSDTTPTSFEDAIREKLVELKKKFVGETASRVKVKLEGTIFLSNWWAIEDILGDIQKEVFDNTYNILEFRWDDGGLVKRAPVSQQKGVKLYEYLVDDPVKDFEKYINKRSLTFGYFFECFASRLKRAPDFLCGFRSKLQVIEFFLSQQQSSECSFIFSCKR